MTEKNLIVIAPTTFEWAFEMTQSVSLKLTGETGSVTGRKEKFNQEDQYEVTYEDNNGCFARRWFLESDLQAVKMQG